MLDPRYAVHDLEYQIERPPPSLDSERINAPPPRPSRSRVLLASAFTVSILLAALGLLLGIPGVVAIFATLAIAFGAIRIDRKARRILSQRTRLADSTTRTETRVLHPAEQHRQGLVAETLLHARRHS